MRLALRRGHAECTKIHEKIRGFRASSALARRRQGGEGFAKEIAVAITWRRRHQTDPARLA